MAKEIIVFRYGHREVRDYRVTSHCSLVARALGAKKIIVCGEKDESMQKSVNDVTKRWGGSFKVTFVNDWKKELKKIKKKYCLVHLTMYGEQIIKKEKEIIKKNKICIIIGSQKVEKEVYLMADFNISITNQPHSEIAALAITLDRLQSGNELNNNFKGAKLKIVPSKMKKEVIALK